MKFSSTRAQLRFKHMHPTAQKIATEMDQYAQDKYNIELTITETVTSAKEDKELNRESDTHRTRRAWDVRTRDLPDSLIAELCSVFRKKYGLLGAVKGTEKRLIVYKPHGTGPHLHCQLSRKHSLPTLTYL